jgi:hypothetical protein
MSYQQQPPIWPPQPAKKRRPLMWIAIAALSVLVGGALLGGILDATDGNGTPAAGHSKAALPQDPCGGGLCQTEPVVAATTPDVIYTPKAKDFELTPKVTSKQCFGSAGCSVDIEVRVGYEGSTLSENDTWQVTYQLTGDESGPIIGSFELTGTTYDVNKEFLSTKSSKTKISIKVTDVEKVGL